MKPNPDQIPLSFLVPESNWTPPTELPDLRRAPRIALDVETRDNGLANDRGSGWATHNGYICGLAVGWNGGEVYIPTRHPDTQNFDPKRVAEWVGDHIKAGVQIVTQNGGYDFGWMNIDWGVPLPAEGQVLDLQAMAVLLDENRLSYSLDAICKWWGIEGKDETLLLAAGQALGLGKTSGDIKSNLWRLPAKFVGPYAQRDVGAPLILADKMMPEIVAQDLGDALRLECDLIPMVVAMRRAGIRINTTRAETSIRDLYARRDAVLAELSRQLMVGRPVEMEDIRSPKFLEKAFKDAGIPFHRTAKSGQGSFQKDWMEEQDHWLPKGVVQAKRFHDTAEKFIQGFILDYTHRGRLHAEIHQLRDADDSGRRKGTRSYRFSYSDPPLQQMPSPKRDKEMGRIIRDLFMPEEGEQWAKCDYSQQEFRLMVHFASLLKLEKVEDAVTRYREDPNTDFHNVVMEMTGLSRPESKDCSFAKAFGAGTSKFALMTGREESEARTLMDQYDEKFPFIKRLSDAYQAAAKRKGYIRLIDGARCRFDLWEPAWGYKGVYHGPCELAEAQRRVADPSHPWHNAQIRRSFTHKAMNRGIQGSAARQTKLAMREMWRQGIIPLLQMHDELDDSVAGPIEAQRLKEIMESVVKLEIPVRAEVDLGPSWGEAG